MQQQLGAPSLSPVPRKSAENRSRSAQSYNPPTRHHSRNQGSLHQKPPRARDTRRSGVRLSPQRGGNRGLEIEYFDRDRKVSVKIVLRRFEVACLCVAFACVILSIFGGRLSPANREFLVNLFQSLTGLAGLSWASSSGSQQS